MDPIDFDPDDLDRVISESERSVRNLAGALDELSRVTGQGESRSGAVTARVDAGGRLDDLRLAPRTSRMELDELTGEILQAVRAAQDDQARRLRDVLPPTSFGGLSAEAVTRRFQDLQDGFSRQMHDRLDALETIRRRALSDG
ncbi:YbaB/EbfC family nucleoid-associated protein [Nonomuraea sp. NPDC049637]|uniref:YbaB/EbfC family nucleoid-associated protein n=1 Tax=Nonomuraea sp. NPDC049637 TaxID=3154356 RepID=UPI00343DC7A2